MKLAEEGKPLRAGKAPGKKAKLDESAMKLLEEDLHARPAVIYEKRADLLWYRQIVVVDNLSAHKSERARELIKQRGCQLLLYLPPYSPDFNPIEEAFSKIKSALRKAGARTREALIEALGVAISAVTARDAQGFFKHSGYHLPVHLL